MKKNQDVVELFKKLNPIKNKLIYKFKKKKKIFFFNLVSIYIKKDQILYHNKFIKNIIFIKSEMHDYLS
jgi:hypothetical protein